MKAIVVSRLGGPEVLKLVEMPIPPIGPKQVLIKVEKTSVNFADIKSRSGKKGEGNFPFVPGLDAAGTIVEIGNEVQNHSVGQRVVAFPANGSYAEYVAADENLTFSIPESLDFNVAAASPTVSFLSYKLLAKIGRIEEGETVVVHSAAGGVGLTAVQMAKILGAGRVIGTVGNQLKADAVLHAGADEVIVYEQEDFAKRVNELTNGEGAHIILDSVAGRISEKSMNCLADYGRLVHFGNSSGVAGTFRTSELHASCRSVLGFSFGTTRKKRPHTLQSTAKKVFEYLEDGRLKMNIGKILPLEEAAHAHALIESRKNIGKILLSIKD
ncbi:MULTISPECIES: zinc-binding dehydrogenase [unclassified Bacillus (in: firmicutes)]|uniref:quinone oxidoreductase family protein n=1 Tax=unclassified Bacillus (in: firmicutes) TaxID=185979 RepID=UPI0008F2AD69|nr:MULTISPECIES: zinc-binding dehydrogenase [unclassified Bacillus (in: firmicutes)]SFB11817.1 NADPH2:quinone reductase [Bacillus sp. UNCCL13]SFQ90419.1 NADPH2:quinone reductase [Bacillus sp. cl95]